MSPKARGLAQHGGPPGWLEESLFRTVPVALIGAAQLRADGISSCCCKCTQPSVMSFITQGRHGLVL